MNIVNLPEATVLRKEDCLLSSSYKRSPAPHLEVGTCKHLHGTLFNARWLMGLILCPLLMTSNVFMNAVVLPCTRDTVFLWSSSTIRFLHEWMTGISLCCRKEKYLYSMGTRFVQLSSSFLILMLNVHEDASSPQTVVVCA